MSASQMVTKQAGEDPELYRREAMGAFAHEVRTPLTSIKMVMELARRQSRDGEFILDAELAEMLRTSVEDLQELADDLQEASRLERGRLVLAMGPCDLGAAVDAARDMMVNGPQLAGTSPHGVEGPWDARRLVRALAGFAQAANRIGDGSGAVRFDWEELPESVSLVFGSGSPGGEPRAIAA
ncbi:MAG TPA: histidine kinase dimerization/phospho-acceptor domain-containing protein, partial [Tepidiformaceae bacterium]|nr:histidine kinase dimerization/phospho-acceptor domain-containing protein [Tepidiformaceae bacterium]